MKAMSQIEQNKVIDTTKVLEGARFQEVVTSGQILALAFWSRGQMLWLMLDLNSQGPTLLPFSEQPLKIANKKTPLQLFLRAHFVGKVLKNIEVKLELGRVVFLKFSEDVELEIRLIPRSPNLIARANGKHISFDIVQELVPNVETQASLKERDLNSLRAEWLADKISIQSKSVAKVPSLESAISKREKALQKVKAEIESKREFPYRKIGDWIKENQSLEVPREWETFVDKRRKIAWNLEQCYSQAKEIERKLIGTEERARKLELEISALKERSAHGLPHEPQLKDRESPLKSVGAEGRSLKLSSDIYVVAGKSGADNLKLLRKARAWDIWIHVKDHPSSHAIVFRNKKSELTQAEWQQIAQWFLKMTFSKKIEKFLGEKFDLLIAECRFVTPVKGDRLGRVTYRNERVMPVRFQTS